MSKLSELRDRSRATKSLQEQKVGRIKEAVTDVVNSSAFALSALNHLGDESSEQKIQEFASTVASHVAEVVVDPKNDFLDTCKARGMSDRKIQKAVTAINDLFNLTDSSDYEEKVEAVALYLQKNPSLYEDIALLA